MRDALFMGLITASITHEMQNVMAIVRESGALVGDILHVNGTSRLKHGDKILGALGNIDEQVRRGRDLMLMLNGFAHAPTDFPSACDAVRFAAQIAPALIRLGHLRECVFSFERNAEPLYIKGNAMMLMQGIYLAGAAVLESCAPGDTVRLSVEPHDGGVRVAVRAGTSSTEPAAGQDLTDVLQVLAGEFYRGPGCCILQLRPAAADEVRTA